MKHIIVILVLSIFLIVSGIGAALIGFIINLLIWLIGVAIWIFAHIIIWLILIFGVPFAIWLVFFRK
jgi:hypothetical protein